MMMMRSWLDDTSVLQALATTEDESRQFEFNARNQITLWGPDGRC